MMSATWSARCRRAICLRLRAEEAVELGDEIDQAKDVHELADAWSKLAHVSAELMHEGMPAREIAAVISHELGELTRRAAVLAEGAMKDEAVLAILPVAMPLSCSDPPAAAKACWPWIRTMR